MERIMGNHIQPCMISKTVRLILLFYVSHLSHFVYNQTGSSGSRLGCPVFISFRHSRKVVKIWKDLDENRRFVSEGLVSTE